MLKGGKNRRVQFNSTAPKKRPGKKASAQGSTKRVSQNKKRGASKMFQVLGPDKKKKPFGTENALNRRCTNAKAAKKENGQKFRFHGDGFETEAD